MDNNDLKLPSRNLKDRLSVKWDVFKDNLKDFAFNNLFGEIWGVNPLLRHFVYNDPNTSAEEALVAAVVPGEGLATKSVRNIAEFYNANEYKQSIEKILLKLNFGDEWPVEDIAKLYRTKFPGQTEEVATMIDNGRVILPDGSGLTLEAINRGDHLEYKWFYQPKEHMKLLIKNNELQSLAGRLVNERYSRYTGHPLPFKQGGSINYLNFFK